MAATRAIDSRDAEAPPLRLVASNAPQAEERACAAAGARVAEPAL
jgi:hypothetical protein